ncbi:MAG TPA: hypothetical protein VF271_01910 [Rhodanobacteraceae bacterium]
MNKTIASVKFAQFAYTDVHHVESSDAFQIQKDITPDFLGWISFDFFRSYAIKIDYQKKAAEALSVRTDNKITFAYNLLSKYKTVWDYTGHKIYLLKYGGTQGMPSK